MNDNLSRHRELQAIQSNRLKRQSTKKPKYGFLQPIVDKDRAWTKERQLAWKRESQLSMGKIMAKYGNK